MHTQKPLPDDVVERLFTALYVRYGAPFTDRWRDLDLKAVKGDWARELAGFAYNLAALKFALDHLPEKPPTVIEFRKLANAAPPPPDPHSLVYNEGKTRSAGPHERQALRELAAGIRAGDAFAKPGRDWAATLLERADTSTHAAIAMAREAKRDD